MSTEVIQVVTWIAIALITVFLLWQSKSLVTVAGVVATVKQAQPLAVEAAKVIEMGVMAAEQYGEDRVLVTSDEKLQFAITFFKRWFPAARQFNDKDIIDLIKTAVPIANSITHGTKAAKVVVAEAKVAGPDAPSAVVGSQLQQRRPTLLGGEL